MDFQLDSKLRLFGKQNELIANILLLKSSEKLFLTNFMIPTLNDRLNQLTNSNLELNILESGEVVSEMVMANKFGLMAPLTKGIGKTTERMDKVNSCTLMATSMMAAG